MQTVLECMGVALPGEFDELAELLSADPDSQPLAAEMLSHLVPVGGVLAAVQVAEAERVPAATSCA